MVLSVPFLLPPAVPPWAVMWFLAFALFFIAKTITATARPVPSPSRRNISLAYIFLWVGMDPGPFFKAHPSPSRGIRILPALGKVLTGAILLWGIAAQIPTQPFIAGWIGLIGMVLVLHFGLFHLLAALWQWRGIPVEPIMREPLCSHTLAEFWGERWNRAFNFLMLRFVFRPMRRSLGPTGSAFSVFLVSGIIHDLVISIPAKGGYGLPTFYFILQFTGLWAQKSGPARRFGLNHGFKGWLFTTVCTALPLPLLFHVPFITTVIFPFMKVIGA